MNIIEKIIFFPLGGVPADRRNRVAFYLYCVSGIVGLIAVIWGITAGPTKLFVTCLPFLFGMGWALFLAAMILMAREVFKR